MRKLQRPNILLPTLSPAGAGGQEKARRVSIWEQSKNIHDVNKDFPDIWGNADVRGALYSMHGRGCAYCQRNLPGSDRGDVEHYRPKNIYWWMAYDFDNYLLSCSVCNRAIKGNNFPLLPRGRPYDFTKSNKIDEENRALVDPVVDEVDEWLGVDFSTESFETNSFKITVNPGIGKKNRQRCVETIEFFKLNLESDLLTERQLTLHLQLLHLKHAKKGDQESALELKKNASRYQPHAFTVRKLLIEHANCPQFVPTPDEEVEWLVDDFISLLKKAIEGLQQKPNDTRETNQKMRCAWALAVLMKAPPASTEAAIRQRIENAGLLNEVTPLFNKLNAN